MQARIGAVSAFRKVWAEPFGPVSRRPPARAHERAPLTPGEGGSILLAVAATTTGVDAAAVDWLLASREPAIRYLTRRDVLGERDPPDDDAILDGPIVRALLSGQEADGAFGGHPYRKWTGAHWRLVSLV